MLDIKLSTIIWEVLNFLLITLVLYLLVFKPMSKRAKARSIEKAALRLALEQDREEAARQLQEAETRLMKLDGEIQQITDEAYANSRLLQDELLDATRAEASKILQDAIQEARKEQAIELQEHSSALVDLVLEVTKQSLQSVTPPGVHDALVDELSAHIWNLGKTEMTRVQTIRDSLEGRNPSAQLYSPRPLSKEQYVKIYNTFNALSDREIALEVLEDPALIAGLKLRIGDYLIDNSLGSQISQMRQDVRAKLETMQTGDYD